MSDTQRLTMWAIYENPADYPGKFVARELQVSAGKVVARADPLIVCSTLQQARKAIVGDRRDLLNVGRSEFDHASVVEVWL